MRKLGTARLVIIGSAVAAMLVLVLFLYLRQADRMLSGMTLSIMQEIADHDRGFVESGLDKAWGSLASMADRIRSARHTSLDGVQKQLNIEQSMSSFRNVYLVDTRGKLYSGAFLIREGRHYPYMQGLLTAGGRSVTRYTEYDYRVDDQAEMLVYTQSVDPFEVEGIQFTGIVGQANLRDIREHMSLSSFGGLGRSTVVDIWGDFIVKGPPSAGIGQRENLFRNLQNAVFQNGFTLEKLRDAMQERKTISCRYQLDGRQYVLHMLYFDTTDWYMAVTVQSEAFTGLSHRFVLMTVGVLACMLVLIAVLLWSAVRAWKRSVALEARAEAETEFLNRMSHEIRTPLNALIGLNYLMRKSLDDRDNLESYLKKSESTSQYLLGLINDILDISKLSQSSVELICQPFSLVQMMESLHVMMVNRMQERHLSFSVHCDAPYPVIMGDALRLKQVLLNILSNAAKFTPEEGRVDMDLSQERQGDGQVLVRISIRDNGIGMSEGFQKHIFESFTQEKPREGDGEPDLQGTGLGMAISSLLMRQMGGTLTVWSSPGRGSVFTATLPAAVAPATVDDVPENRVTSESRPVPERVLIAEDNPLNAEILTRILEKEGVVAMTARNGKLAVEAFAASGPGEIPLILMDARMPVMDGYTAALKIRNLKRPDALSVRIYACTANTAQDARDNAQQSGMNGFLAKPIDVKVLLEILHGGTGGVW